MAPTTSMDVDEAIKKTGGELFRELLRLYSVAELEDYFHPSSGWNNEMMKRDIQLVYAHRIEGGAPDPISLAEVKMPALPQATGVAMALQAAAGGKVSVPMLPASATSLAATAAAELRLTALFIAKWKIDPARTKAALSKYELDVNQRKYVIQHFKATRAPGAPATEELEAFVQICKARNLTSVAAPGVPALATGVKRPLVIPSVPGVAATANAAKRPFVAVSAQPAFAAPAVGVSGAAAALRAKILAAQAQRKGAGPALVLPK